MKERAPRNRTLTCDDEEIEILARDLLVLAEPAALEQIANRIIHGDTLSTSFPCCPPASPISSFSIRPTISPKITTGTYFAKKKKGHTQLGLSGSSLCSSRP